MSLKDIMPWKKKHRGQPVPVRGSGDPLPRLREELNRVFDDFLSPRFGWEGLRDEGQSFLPSVDITENDKHINVSLEIPGVDEKDVDVVLDGNDRLIVRGEKKVEDKEESEDRYYYERAYGSFERMIPLPGEVDPEGTKASFKKGVLKITLPKSAEARTQRKKVRVN